MSIFDRFLNKDKAKAVELQKDIDALVQFSQGQSFDESNQREFTLSSSSKMDSTKFDGAVLVELWKQVPEISTVLSKITDRAKNVPWGHFKIKDQKSFSQLKQKQIDLTIGRATQKEVKQLQDIALEPIFDEQIQRLLHNPNNLQNWAEMIEQLITYYYVTGDSYLMSLGATGFVPDELKVMASQQTDVVLRKSFIENPFQIGSEGGEIEKYTFDNGLGKVIEFNDPDIIAHMKAPNIIYDEIAWRKGFSPLASAILASRTLKNEYISRLSLVRDRGAMGMMVGDGRAGSTPSPEETKAVYQRLQKFGLGDGKANPYGVTNGAYKWMNMSFNSGELELLAGREANLKTLARKFNVPIDLLIGDTTFNNAQTAGNIIYTSNVIPWLNDFQDKINKILGLVDSGSLIMPIYDNIPELQQDLKAQTEIMATQYEKGIATREEAREGVGRSAEADTDNYKENETNAIKQ
jgi:phage portal protein BeeE